MSVRRVATLVGLDRTIVLTVLARAWPVAAGLLTVWMISLYLSAEQQGYFFTLGSLIALQVLAELGLNQAIVNFASHEAARLTWTLRGTVEGSGLAKSRLRALLLIALQWFGAAGGLMIIALLPLGQYFLQIPGSTSADRTLLAWAWLVPFAAANLLASAALSLLEGCGRVADVSLGRLVQGMVSTGALWVALAAGAGVLALAVQAAVGLLVTAAWLASRYGQFFRDLLAHPAAAQGGLDWRAEMWPFQWRIAVSWVSGLLIAQLFTPLLFATHGPVPAGRMGLTLQVFGALNTVALAWITSHTPRYGQMIALGQGAALDRTFARGLAQSSGVLVLLLALLLGAVWHLHASGSPLTERLLPPPLVAVLCLVALANHVVFAEAALLRAHKRDPFMGLSIGSGIATSILAFVWIPEYGLQGAVAAYASATLVVGLAGGTVVFLRKRRSWWLAGETTALRDGSATR